ncbi:MAG: YqjK-like family protein [Sulfuritalea sp.]|nr:YqjK-like family protein [Sulfuritalea sp.]
MNSPAVEFALKKQRLQIASERLREDIGHYADGLSPIFSAGDYLVQGAHWVRRNPQLLVAAGVTLIVVRPKAIWRLTRRAFFTWQVWRKLNELLAHQLQKSS